MTNVALCLLNRLQKWSCSNCICAVFIFDNEYAKSFTTMHIVCKKKMKP